MRITKSALVIGIVGLMLTVAGCSTQISGVAQRDPVTAPLTLAADGYGIVAGFDDAAAKIEIFTEPQCTHCSELQHKYGDQLAYYITIGSLQVTYRPLTFLDPDYGGYSSKVANALFLATVPAGESTVTGTQFQRFVQELWLNQDPGGSPFTGDELRDMAIRAGLPAAVADKVAGANEEVDIPEMEDNNFDLLYDIDSVDTGTPTVYDLDAKEKLDVSDENWLTTLIQS